jgi:hypothetical protein
MGASALSLPDQSVAVDGSEDFLEALRHSGVGVSVTP